MLCLGTGQIKSWAPLSMIVVMMIEVMLSPQLLIEKIKCQNQTYLLLRAQASLNHTGIIYLCANTPTISTQEFPLRGMDVKIVRALVLLTSRMHFQCCLGGQPAGV